MPGKKSQAKIPGQGQPVDAATDLFWRDNDRFAEVFSKFVFNGMPIDPEDLLEANAVETSVIRMKDGARTALKQTRDVVKSLRGGPWLVILGIENQTYIDPLMPFRVFELNFINLARQVEEIRKKHVAEKKEGKSAKDLGISEDEYMSGFYFSDKLNPVITLVIYYGKEKWRKPRRLADLFKDSPFARFADDMPMYLIDVRHMTKEELSECSNGLKPFFGFLKYENTKELNDYVSENREAFRNVPDSTIDALIDITGSKELAQFKEDFRSEEGGVDVCYGIQYQCNQEGMRGIVFANQRHGISISETVKDIMALYPLKKKDAEKVVKENWRETTSGSEKSN